MAPAVRSGDARLRELERQAASGDMSNLPSLLKARMRAGTLDFQRVRQAEFFSRHIGGNGYEFWPLGRQQYVRISGSVPQHSLTLLINRALRSLIPPRSLVRASGTFPSSVNERLHRLGYDLAYTSHDNEYPPYELVAEDDMVFEWIPHRPSALAAMMRLLDKVEEYIEVKPDGWTEEDDELLVGDDEDWNWNLFRFQTAWWDIRERAARGDPLGLAVLRFLRTNSTLHYMEILAPWHVHDRVTKDALYGRRELPPGPSFGDVELALVRSLLAL